MYRVFTHLRPGYKVLDYRPRRCCLTDCLLTDDALLDTTESRTYQSPASAMSYIKTRTIGCLNYSSYRQSSSDCARISLLHGPETLPGSYFIPVRLRVSRHNLELLMKVYSETILTRSTTFHMTPGVRRHGVV